MPGSPASELPGGLLDVAPWATYWSIICSSTAHASRSLTNSPDALVQENVWKAPHLILLGLTQGAHENCLESFALSGPCPWRFWFKAEIKPHNWYTWNCIRWCEARRERNWPANTCLHTWNTMVDGDLGHGPGRQMHFSVIVSTGASQKAERWLVLADPSGHLWRTPHRPFHPAALEPEV